MYLPLNEQGKLIYVYAIYIALVLLNIAAFFSVANIVRHEIERPRNYQVALLHTQIKTAFLLTACISIGLALFHDILQWKIETSGIILFAAFLISQQIVDFFRRSGYVFDGIAGAAKQTLWLYGGRIALIVYFKPDSVDGFLLFMTLPALPLVLVGIGRYYFLGGEPLQGNESAGILRKHFTLAKWNIYSAPLRWIGLHLPVLLVGMLHSVESAAILGTIRSITTFVNILLEMLETIVPAWLSAKLNHSGKALQSATFALLGIGTFIWLLGTFFIWLLGNSAIGYLLGATYADYTALLYIIWAGSGCYFAGRVVTLHYRMRMNTQLEFYSLAVGMVGFILSIPLITWYGAWGGAWCLTSTQIATLGGILMYRRAHLLPTDNNAIN